MDREFQLIGRARAGERAAFEELVDIYKERAFGLAYYFLGNVEDAKDILQEAFVKAYVGIRDFRGGSSFYTWFYRILVNLCKDSIRHKKVKSRIFADPLPGEGDEPAVPESADGAPSPSEAAINSELKAKMDEAISKLPERQKAVFILKHVQGMKSAEIGQVLGCGESTVKVHLFRAEKALQKMLSPYLSDAT